VRTTGHRGYEMRLGFLAGCALAAALLSAPAQAGTLFALENATDQLYQIDTGTLAVSLVGALGTDANFAGLAYDNATGTLYGIGGRDNANLFSISTTTGAATLIGSHGVNDLFGLEFDSSTGTLYGSQFSGGSGLYTLNTTTGAATAINAAMSRGIGGLAYDSTRGELVGIEDGNGDLYAIDRTTGAQTLRYDGDFVDDSGLAYDGDLDLFWDIDYQGRLFSYDPNAGYARTTRLSGLGTFDGLAYAGTGGAGPIGGVPEPASWALMISGFGLAGSALRRRRSALA